MLPEKNDMIAGFELGVMQGRLLPKYMGRYQAHPLGYWKEEFPIAATLGLELIEFILDFNDANQNPLLSEQGVTEILQLSERTGVRVKTVCADYFMEAPVHAEDETIARQSQKTLSALLEHGKMLGLTDIVIPCVDQSALKGSAAVQRFVQNLRPHLETAVRYNINLSLETDLAPMPFQEILMLLDCPKVTVNYDTGNSASLGFCSKEEFATYGTNISDIHIKDRVLGGGSTVLGTGNWDYTTFFHLLDTYAYSGPIIMQAYRDDDGLDAFSAQLKWLKEQWRSQHVK